MRRSFGGLLAVDVEHLEVQRNTITALIGPNGAGKTTLFNLLTGFDDAGGGTLELRRRRARGLARVSHRAVRAWCGRSSSRRRWRGMTVLDNMLLAAPSQRGERICLRAAAVPLARAGGGRTRNVRSTCSSDFGLDDKRNDFAGTLSGGQRKLLEMARALMVDPKLRDARRTDGRREPGARAVAARRTSASCATKGVTVVFVEHDMDVVMTISDWVVCMAEGR